MSLVDGVEVGPPIQIGVPLEFVNQVRSLFEEAYAIRAMKVYVFSVKTLSLSQVL